MDYVYSNVSGGAVCSGSADTDHPTILAAAGDVQTYATISTKFNHVQKLNTVEGDPYFNTRFIFFYSDPDDSYKGKAVIGYMPGLAYGDTKLYFGTAVTFSEAITKNISSVTTIYRDYIIVYYSKDDGLAYSRVLEIDELTINLEDEIEEAGGDEIVSAAKLNETSVVVATASANELGYNLKVHLDRVSGTVISQYPEKPLYSDRYVWETRSQKDIQLKVFASDDSHFTIVHVPPFNSYGKVVATQCEVINNTSINLLNSFEVGSVQGSAEEDYDTLISGSGSEPNTSSVVSYIRKNSKGRVTVVGGGGYWKNFDYYDATHKSNKLTKKNDYNFALLFSNGNLYRKNFSLSEEKFSDIQIDYASPAFSRSGTFISNEIGSPEYFIEVFSDSQNCYFVVQSYLTEYEVSAGKIICSGSAEVEKGYGVARVISTLIPTKAYYTASGDIVIGRRSLVYTGTGQVLLSGTGGPFEVELIAVASGGIIMGGAALLPTKDSGLYGDVFYGDTYYRNS